MKIAFVVINANRFEGTSRAVLEVAERLGQEHEIDLWARTVEDVDLDRVKWIPVTGPARPEVADFASFKWTCDRRLRKSDYDVIHSAGPNTRMADVYTIQTVHPVKVQQFEPLRQQSNASSVRRLSWRIYDRQVISAERQAYRADGVRGPRAFLPVSQGTMAEMLDEYPSAKASHWDSLQVIPNGADLNCFHPANREKYRNQVRNKHGLTEQDFVLLFSGGDWRRKGLDLALQSLARIQDRSVKLLVAGHDRAGGDVREMVERLALQDRVCFAGFRDDIHRYYAAGDLFVFPTAYEAFSLATIEAAASGLPVLMPDVSGGQELIGCGKTGAMIKREPQHIADTIMRFFKSSELLRDAGIAARELVKQRFNWDVITQQTLGIYKEILRQRAM